MTSLSWTTRLIIIGLIALIAACSKVSDKKVQQHDDSPIQWLTFEEGLKKATTEKKLMFVDLYADWCGPCKYMDATTYKDSSVAALLNSRFVPIKIDADQAEPMACEVKHQLPPMECAAKVWQVQGLPGTIILDSKGYFLTSTMGIQEAKNLIESLNLLLDKEEVLLNIVSEEIARQADSIATSKIKPTPN
ncbi:MAG: DUF255 domain-containing protein [Fibrobacterales bacterium]